MTFIILNKIDTRAYREDEGDPQRLIPVAVQADAIRCFNPRRQNAPGSRITFKDGGGFAVAETGAQILTLIDAAHLVIAWIDATDRAAPPQVSDAN